MRVRAFEADDAAALWELERAFEAELGAAGGDGKAARYAGKLDDDYRAGYLDWIRRGVEGDPGCVRVAVPGDAAGPDGGTGSEGPGAGAGAPGRELAGYAFVLPGSLSYVWDAAVLNEVYVRPAHRGTGAADDLLAAAVAHARDQDLPLRRMVLDVDAGNDRARAFYARHGFEHWSEMVARGL
jgi:ribosomal protein S18 acetylase RimI-like enzyme